MREKKKVNTKEQGGGPSFKQVLIICLPLFAPACFLSAVFIYALLSDVGITETFANPAIDKVGVAVIICSCISALILELMEAGKYER